MTKESIENWEDVNLDDNNVDNLYDTEEDYEYEGDTDDYEEDDYSAKNNDSAKNTKLAILLALIFILAILGILVVTKIVLNQTQSHAEKDNSSNITNTFFDENNINNENMMDVDFNNQNETTEGSLTDNVVLNKDDANNMNVELNEQNIENQMEKPQNDTVEISNIENNKENEESNGMNNSIMVALNGITKRNPFKPPVIEAKEELPFDKFDGIQFEIIEPPTKLISDKSMENLLQTQISGILYDDESPSAIIHLAGKDEFVKIGDVVFGYKINNITRNKVEIIYKNNTYVASIGELFVPGSLEAQSDVANLNSKFAGRYKQRRVEE